MPFAPVAPVGPATPAAGRSARRLPSRPWHQSRRWRRAAPSHCSHPDRPARRRHHWWRGVRLAFEADDGPGGVGDAAVEVPLERDADGARGSGDAVRTCRTRGTGGTRGAVSAGCRPPRRSRPQPWPRPCHSCRSRRKRRSRPWRRQDRYCLESLWHPQHRLGRRPPRHPSRRRDPWPPSRHPSRRRDPWPPRHPSRPAGPVAPATPVAPAGPVAPATREGPATPVAPCGPVGPVGPFPPTRTMSTCGSWPVLSFLSIWKFVGEADVVSRARPLLFAIHDFTTSVTSMVTKLFLSAEYTGSVISDGLPRLGLLP